MCTQELPLNKSLLVVCHVLIYSKNKLIMKMLHKTEKFGT